MKIPTLGTHIRALRLRYGWCAEIKGFIRISGSGPFRIEICPADRIPSPKTREHDGYFIWWEKKDIANMLPTIPALAGIKEVTKHEVFWIDDDGERIGR